MLENSMDRPIFEDHIGLVKSIVFSFDKSCSPEDSEMFPVACIGLIKAISTFEPGRSKFSYWATKIIRNMLINELRSESKFPMLSLDSMESEGPPARTERFPAELVLEMVEPSPSDTPSETENKLILRRHYLDLVPMAEIAREIGFTREAVRQRVNKAVDSIRKRCGIAFDDHPFWLHGNYSPRAV